MLDDVTETVDNVTCDATREYYQKERTCLVLVAPSTREGSVNWLVCICCGYHVTILWGLTELVMQSFSEYSRQVFYAGTEGGHCQGACRPQWFFYVPDWDGTDIDVTLWFTRDKQSPKLRARLCYPLHSPLL